MTCRHDAAPSSPRTGCDMGKLALRIMATFAVPVILCSVAIVAFGRDDGQYADRPQAERDLYRNAELTPKAQKRFGFKSCCAHSDVVKTKFRVIKTDAADEWFWLLDGAHQRVPPDIIHCGENAPDGPEQHSITSPFRRPMSRVARFRRVDFFLGQEVFDFTPILDELQLRATVVDSVAARVPDVLLIKPLA
jgi:hypothetical protein